MTSACNNNTSNSNSSENNNAPKTTNFKKDSNRAFETAKLTTYWLYLAQVPEAIDFGRLIGIDKMDASQTPNHEQMCYLNPIVHEIRYKSINHYIRTSGCKHVLDIACGYSPRGLQLACEGFHYHGADLPVVAEELAPLAQASGLDNYEYCAVDATNYDSLRKITDKIHEPICVVIEGLEMYLTATEVATVRENIARILRDHPGSVFVTTDPANGNILANTVLALYGFLKFMPTIGMVFEMYNWASDGGITMQTAPKTLRSEIRRMQEAGLEAKRCTLLPDGGELSSLSRLLELKSNDNSISENAIAENAVQKIQKLTRKTFVFVAKLAGEDGETIDKTHNAESNHPTETTCDSSSKIPDNTRNFTFISSIDSGVFTLAPSGRIDSLSAPEILKCFEKAKNSDQIQRFVINMENVTYISSAGSRVIYLIRKELGGSNNLSIINASPSVEAILQNDEIIERL